MPVPRRGSRVGTDMDAEFARRGIELGLHRQRKARIDHQELLELDLFERAGTVSVHRPSRSQSHLDIARPGEHGRTGDDVVGDPVELCRHQIALPRRLGQREAHAQQRVIPAAGANPAALLGFPPMLLRLERISRQLDRRRGLREHLTPVEVRAHRVQPAERTQQRRPLALLATQRAQHQVRHRLLAQTAGNVAPKHRMRADLQEHAVTGVDDAAHRTSEIDGVAHIAIPVPRIDLAARHRSAGHRGEERRRGRLRPDVAQALEQFLFERLHLRTVIGHVHLQRAAEATFGIDRLLDLGEDGGIARERDRARTIDRGDRDGPRMSCNESGGLLLGDAGGQHCPCPATRYCSRLR